MTQSLRIGIVGSRFAARFHADCLRRVTGVPIELAGAWSPRRESVESFARDKQCRAFASFEAMLDAVDVVDICSLASTHERYAVAAANAGRHVIVEKPFTGCFGPENPPPGWRGDTADKAAMLDAAMESARRIVQAVRHAGVLLAYAENWVYAPSVQKERQVLEASKGQVLWMIGEESHSGSHSPSYGVWRLAGGGSIVGKACHPLTAMLYLKRVEAAARSVAPIRPAGVSARTHRLTAPGQYIDAGFLRTDYTDVEDFSQMHVVFDDGTVADVFAGEIVLGGVHNWLEIFANNHRMRCNLNPTDACTLYNPREEQLRDVYLVEKIGTKQGWCCPSPDEDFAHGYPQEMQDFAESIVQKRAPRCGAELGLDTVAVLYAAYLSAERKGQEVEVPRE